MFYYSPFGVPFESPVVRFVRAAVFTASMIVIAKTVSSVAETTLNRSLTCYCPLASSCANGKAENQNEPKQTVPSSAAPAALNLKSGKAAKGKKGAKTSAFGKKKKSAKSKKPSFKKLEKALLSDKTSSVVREATLNDFRM